MREWRRVKKKVDKNNKRCYNCYRIKLENAVRVYQIDRKDPSIRTLHDALNTTSFSENSRFACREFSFKRIN